MESKSIQRKKVRVLAIAYAPENKSSISHWCPFEDGESLGDILDAHNKSCRIEHQKRGWVDGDIDEFVEEINIVPKDFTYIDTLEEEDFSDIYIILLDQGFIPGKEKKLTAIRLFMSRFKHPYFVVQVKDRNITSVENFFYKLPIYTLYCCTQKEFEIKILNRWCALTGGLNPAGPNAPPPSDPSYSGLGRFLDQETHERKAAFFNAFSRVKDKVLQASVEQDLTNDQIRNMANNAVFQELAITSVIERTNPLFRNRINLDRIHEPVINMQIEPTCLKPQSGEVDLVHFRPTRPIGELSTEQRKILGNFGIRGKTYSAVDFDLPSTRDAIGRLGNAVEVTRFSGKLPFVKLKD